MSHETESRESKIESLLEKARYENSRGATKQAISAIIDILDILRSTAPTPAHAIFDVNKLPVTPKDVLDRLKQAVIKPKDRDCDPCRVPEDGDLKDFGLPPLDK